MDGKGAIEFTLFLVLNISSFHTGVAAASRYRLAALGQDRNTLLDRQDCQGSTCQRLRPVRS